MSTRIRDHFHSKAGIVALILIAFFVIATEFFVENETRNLETEKRLDTIAFGNVLQSRVDRELNSLLFISTGLSSYIRAYHHDLDSVKLLEILSDMYSNSQHVRNLGIAVGYQMAYIYPLKGNEKALELNYQNVPEQLVRVDQAIASRKGILDGPLTLYQGGQALVYRYPVFVDGKFWGIISTVINTPSFFNAAFSGVSNERYEFSIRKFDDSGRPGAIFYGEPDLFNNKLATLVTNHVPNGKWQWAILNKNKDRIASTTLIIRLLGWTLSMVVGLIVFLLLREHAQLTKDALYDGLTGLANRRLLMDRIEQTLLGLDRMPNQTCSVFLFDLNGFKKINDTYGHHAGDVVLQKVAQRVKKEIRSADTVARLGGDEYVVVVTHDRQNTGLQLLEERLRQAILIPVEYHGHQLNVGTSIGIATYPEDGADPQQLLRAADAKMYMEKKGVQTAYETLDID